jgi:hypothetical protein
VFITTGAQRTPRKLFNRDKRDEGDKEMVGCGDEGTASMGRVYHHRAHRGHRENPLDFSFPSLYFRICI